MYDILLAIALSFVTVWTNPNSGKPTYISWCRNTGDCETTIKRVVHNVHFISNELDVDEVAIMSLVMTESRLNPKAKSSIGAFGLLQLHPRSKAGLAAKHACRGKTKIECEISNLRFAIAEFKRVHAECKTYPRTFYAWRTGKCGRGPYSNQTYQLYRKLRYEVDEKMSRLNKELFVQNE